MFEIRRLCLVLCLSMLAIGCGNSADSTVAVKGKLTKGGEPYKLERAPGAGPLPPGEGGVRVLFKRIGGKENYESYAILDLNTMTFSVPGNTGSGIPAGDYEVIVTANTGEKASKAKGSSGPPMGAGPPGMGPLPGLEGQEIAREKISIPDSGRTDLEIVVK